MAELKIFRAGTHTDGGGNVRVFSELDLQAIATGYDTAKHQAPIVLGHPTTNGPAHGWISGMSVRNGELYASTDKIDPGLQKAVDDGKYRFLSASFYAPQSSGNPTPGQYHLRHVGILGASPPAIKGLGEVRFSDTEDGVFNINFSEGKVIMDKEKELEEKEKALLKQQAEFAEKQAVLAAREAAVQVAEKAMAEQADIVFAEKQVAEGRVLPAHKSMVVSILGALRGGGSAVEFAESDGKIKKTTGHQAFSDLLASLPIAIEYSEIVGKEDAGGSFAEMASMPAGFEFDPLAAKQHQAILAYAEKHQVDYFTAAMRTGGK